MMNITTILFVNIHKVVVICARALYSRPTRILVTVANATGVLVDDLGAERVKTSGADVISPERGARIQTIGASAFSPLSSNTTHIISSDQNMLQAFQ